jgi:dihydroxyacetone kinase-like protein
VDVALARSWVAAIAAAVAEQADYLTQLDSAIGDADHGVNLNRGFTAVVAALSSGAEPAAVGDVFVKTGTTLVSKVGGAAGPLYGSAFRAIGKALPPGSSTVDAAELGAALRAGLAAVQKLGAAVPGDKTIVDAYGPAVAAFEKAADDGLAAAARAAADAAADGMRATIELHARKGRASYLGPRSVGHQDPGATSTWLVFQALADVTA